MKAVQLVLDFFRAARTPHPAPPAPPAIPAAHSRVPDAPTQHANARESRRGGLRRDPILEQLCADLLAQAGVAGMDVKVLWNPAMRTVAGYANYAKKEITLNPALIDISPQEVQRTLRHELAHLLAAKRAGRRRPAPHGPEWKAACADLGIPGEKRCHDLPFARRSLARKHIYSCPQCGTVLARVRPLKRRIACLKCCRAYNGGKYSERFRFRPA